MKNENATRKNHRTITTTTTRKKPAPNIYNIKYTYYIMNQRSTTTNQHNYFLLPFNTKYVPSSQPAADPINIKRL